MILIHIQGSIISGDFDENSNQFYIQQLKGFETGSVLTKEQFTKLYLYLKQHEDQPDGQVITLYDQMPVLLTQLQIKQLLKDFEQLQTMYT
ncbi:hypothetical protein JOC85_004342 [Bacillus mesophilus]|uniref:Uncharacterized protein n=1 Tax=Bacillus mesophilus TaxID=1808955 RepID=A0A6M0QCV5_9BACI|nr:hypothetical protein [Bacillus mesophilus]MBM7663466.1 hypothetical protein [Bacillus mesophilus]NEY74184.1 hypothetical protein [Bacillus mesophilus]